MTYWSRSETTKNLGAFLALRIGASLAKESRSLSLSYTARLLHSTAFTSHGQVRKVSYTEIQAHPAPAPKVTNDETPTGQSSSPQKTV